MAGMIADDQFAVLQALRPPGRVWQWSRGGVLWNVMLFMADGLSRLQVFICGLWNEVDPRSCSQTLPEWETATGLPDGCISGGGSTAQRRAAVVARLVATGGASETYFKGLAATYGYDITIDYPALHTMRINSVQAVAITTFKAGQSRAGDPLRTWGNQQLECLLTRVKPAHVNIIFAYGT